MEESTQLALTALSLEDRIALGKSIKKEMLKAPLNEREHYYRKIRELFTDEEWLELKKHKGKNL